MECFFSDISSHVSCGININIEPSKQICPLESCKDNILTHLSKFKINRSSIESEANLILYRAGLFDHQDINRIAICPNHRYHLGKGWKSSKYCMLKEPMKKTCNGTRKPEKATVTVYQSKCVFGSFGILIPVGAGVCRQCRREIVQNIGDNGEKTYVATSVEVDDSYTSPELCDPKDNIPMDSHDYDVDFQKCQQRKENNVQEGNSYVLRNRNNTLKRPFPYAREEDKYIDCIHENHSQVSTVSIESQGSIWLPDSQESSDTNPQHCANTPKRNALDNFLQSFDSSPIKKQLRSDWNESSQRTQHDYTKKAKQIFEHVVTLLAPGQEHFLIKAVMDEYVPIYSLSDSIQILSKAYDLSADWGTQRQILSIFAQNFSFNELNLHIPSISQYKYTAARKHALARGHGQPVEVSHYNREGLSNQQIKHFIDFVLSPSIMTDSPVLETKLKLSNGEVYQVPQIILNSVRTRVVEQYLQFCNECDYDNVASERSYMRVLEAMEPNIRKSMKGLDNFAAEGAKAIDDLKQIANVLAKHGKGIEWEEAIIQRLSNVKQYLKQDYKLHVSVGSEIADHCCEYALSSDNINHSVPCSHSHDDGCPSCNDLYLIVDEIKAATEKTTYDDDDQKDDIEYTLCQSIKALDDWKKHILRSVNQDRARRDIIENMTERDVLIERDWAMKFLPMMYRESQSKWFAKRGLNWNITVGTYRYDGDLHSHTIVHMFDNANQDALTSNAILRDSLTRFKSTNPNLERAFIRSDNAGCFHSVEAIFSIPSLNEFSELKVSQVDFADPQGGKSICDRRAAHIKGAIGKYVNEGNNVTTSSEFMKAITESNIKNVEIVIATPPSSCSAKKSVKVKDITTLNNFEYNSDFVLAFRQYKIGNGVRIDAADIKMYDNFPTLNVLKSGKTEEFHRIPKTSETVRETHVEQENHSNCDDGDDDNDSVISSYLFTCPTPNCMLSFMKHGNLIKHLDKGDHHFKRDNKSLSDKSKIEFIRQLDTKKSNLVNVSTCATSVKSNLQKGWALKSKRIVKRFNSNQSDYLKEMFQKGEVTGHKSDPEEVSISMRTVKKDGKRRFLQSDFLNANQIASYFSRLSLDKRKTAQKDYKQEDLEAEEFVNELTEIRNSVCNLNASN